MMLRIVVLMVLGVGVGFGVLAFREGQGYQARAETLVKVVPTWSQPDRFAGTNGKDCWIAVNRTAVMWPARPNGVCDASDADLSALGAVYRDRREAAIP